MATVAENYTAAQALEIYATTVPKGFDRRLLKIVTTNNWAELVKVHAFKKPKAWRLVCGDRDDDTKEEIVFSIQGSITGQDLPPVTQKLIYDKRKFRYLRQSIKVAGLGTAAFNAALCGMAKIHNLFDREFRAGALEDWMEIDGQEPGNDVFEASNRYFTPARDTSANDGIPFSKSVNPKGILQGMAGNEYKHTDDNDVVYFRRHTDADGNTSHESVGPQSFRIGDIVELQMSFVVVPLKGDRFKMVTVLRSIALIDGSFSKKTRMSGVALQAPTALKRSISYAHVDEEDTQGGKRAMAEMAAMQVEDS